MTKKVRIKDIAARLGLSSTLVSLVLNNKANQHGIKIETQERVIALASKMGYFGAEGKDIKVEVSDKGPGVVGLIVTSLKDPFVIEISEHMRKAFESIGYGFSIITWNSSDPRFNRIVSNIKRMFNAVVLAGDAADDTIIRSLRTSAFPFVILEKSDVNLRLNAVRSDCVAGADKLIDHLLELKYERITLVSSKSNSPYLNEKVDCIKERLELNLEKCALEEHKVELTSANLISEDELKPFFRPPFSTQVIIVAESMLVYPILISLDNLKIRIPGDVALISLEDGPGFDLLSPPITRLRRDIPSMASKVVSMLWAEIKNSGKSKYKRTASIAPELIIAKSSGNL